MWSGSDTKGPSRQTIGFRSKISRSVSQYKRFSGTFRANIFITVLFLSTKELLGQMKIGKEGGVVAWLSVLESVLMLLSLELEMIMLNLYE